MIKTKFSYSSNGDGSYSVYYGTQIVAWCKDKSSAIYLRKVANSIQQSENLIDEDALDFKKSSTPKNLSPFDHYLPPLSK